MGPESSDHHSLYVVLAAASSKRACARFSRFSSHLSSPSSAAMRVRFLRTAVDGQNERVLATCTVGGGRPFPTVRPPNLTAILCPMHCPVPCRGLVISRHHHGHTYMHAQADDEPEQSITPGQPHALWDGRLQRSFRADDGSRHELHVCSSWCLQYVHRSEYFLRHPTNNMHSAQ